MAPRLAENNARVVGLIYALVDHPDIKNKSESGYYEAFANKMNDFLGTDEWTPSKVEKFIIEWLKQHEFGADPDESLQQRLIRYGVGILRKRLAERVFEHANNFRNTFRLDPLNRSFLNNGIHLRLLNKECGAVTSMSENALAPGDSAEPPRPEVSVTRTEASDTSAERRKDLPHKALQPPDSSTAPHHEQVEQSSSLHTTMARDNNDSEELKLRDRMRWLEEENRRLKYKYEDLKQEGVAELKEKNISLKRKIDLLEEESARRNKLGKDENEKRIWGLVLEKDSQDGSYKRMPLKVFSKLQVENKRYSQPVLERELIRGWHDLNSNAVTDFQPWEDLGPMAEDTVALRSDLHPLLGSYADDARNFQDFVATFDSIEPIIRVFGMVLVYEWVFGSGYPYFFDEDNRNLNAILEVTAYNENFEEAANLRSAVCIWRAEEPAFLEEELPKRAQMWQEDLSQKFGCFFANALGNDQYWYNGTADVKGVRKHLITETFTRAVKLKLLCLPSRLEDRYHILWVVAGTAFDGTWMEPEGGDNPPGESAKVKLCMVPALLLGTPCELRQPEGIPQTKAYRSKKMIHEAIFGRKFVVGETGHHEYQRASSEAGIDRSVCIDKARVILF